MFHKNVMEIMTAVIMFAPDHAMNCSSMFWFPVEIKKLNFSHIYKIL